MKNIKLLSLFALVTFGAMFITSCGPDDGTTPDPSPEVSFLTDSIYISSDVSLEANTAFKMAINASHTKDIVSIKVVQSLDGQVDVDLIDSTVKEKTFTEFVFSGTTALTAGTEIYTFIVEGKNGLSTSKSITITNIGDPGKALIALATENDGVTPFRVYNFRGPLKGAYKILGGPLSISDPDSDKDIQDSTMSGATWTGNWGSRNGTTFKKLAVGPGLPDWNNITNDATITAAWDGGGASTGLVSNLEVGDLLVLNIKNSGDYALVLVTGVDKSKAKSEFIEFEYKVQQK